MVGRSWRPCPDNFASIDHARRSRPTGWDGWAPIAARLSYWPDACRADPVCASWIAELELAGRQRGCCAVGSFARKAWRSPGHGQTGPGHTRRRKATDRRKRRAIGPRGLPCRCILLQTDSGDGIPYTVYRVSQWTRLNEIFRSQRIGSLGSAGRISRGAVWLQIVLAIRCKGAPARRSAIGQTRRAR